MAWSLPRSRSAAAISYGYLGRSISNVSSDSASRLLTFRRLAIPYHLVSESSVTMTRYQVLVDEYTAADTGRANSLKPLFGRTGSGETRRGRGTVRAPNGQWRDTRGRGTIRAPNGQWCDLWGRGTVRARARP